MHRIGKRFRQTDWLLLGSCAVAAGYGWTLVRSATLSGAGGNPLMQGLCLIAGVIAAWMFSLLDYHYVLRYWYVAALPVIVLMALTFTSFGYEVPGTDDRNWLMIPLGSEQLLIQPSELLKIIAVITLAYHIGSRPKTSRRWLRWSGIAVHAAVPIGMILLQGDDGNAVVCALLCAAMLIVGGIPIRYLFGTTALATLAVPVIWQRMAPDKQARFLCLFYPEQYSETIGWQQELSVTAIGSGGWFGVGYLNGGNHRLYARQNDFIFSVAGEEFGFAGAVAVLAALAAILCILYRRARNAADLEGRLICTGLLALIASQTVINIGMTLRLMPVLGITLPFFSAGGSSLLTLFVGIGIAMSVHRYRNPHRLY